MDKQFGHPTNLIPTLGLFDRLVDFKVNYFEKSDRASFFDLINAVLSDRSFYIPAFNFVSAEAQLIADIVDRNLMRDIDQLDKFGKHH